MLLELVFFGRLIDVFLETCLALKLALLELNFGGLVDELAVFGAYFYGDLVYYVKDVEGKSLNIKNFLNIRQKL